MKILDLYTKFRSADPAIGKGYEIFDRDPDLRALAELARAWEMDLLFKSC